MNVMDELAKAEIEAMARAIYELEPFYEGGEWVDGFMVSPAAVSARTASDLPGMLT